MKYLFAFFFILNFNKLIAQNIECNFEEVYQNGDVQEGTLIYSDGLLRYQYEDKQLFTLIYNQDYFMIRNNDHSIINKLENDEILNELKFIISNYESLSSFYSKDDLKIKIEKSLSMDFIKRIIINSQKLNLSIYFYNCSAQTFDQKYFQPFALIEIPK